MTESQEFRHWMKVNRNRLRSLAPDEIAYFALLNGFSLGLSCDHISDHVIQLKRLLTFWESPLSEKWMRVASYERGTENV